MGTIRVIGWVEAQALKASAPSKLKAGVNGAIVSRGRSFNLMVTLLQEEADLRAMHSSFLSGLSEDGIARVNDSLRFGFRLGEPGL